MNNTFTVTGTVTGTVTSNPDTLKAIKDLMRDPDDNEFGIFVKRRSDGTIRMLCKVTRCDGCTVEDFKAFTQWLTNILINFQEL